MDPKISVIVPVYKVEKYLRRCVDSVLNQTYQNIEVILVDDGSPDGSPAICDEYAQKDDRVKVIHKKNGGQSSARNAGMEAVTGQYVGFADSDDWIEPDTIEYCINLIQKHNANAVQFDISLCSDPDAKISQPDEIVNVYHDKEILEYYLDSSTRRSGGFSVWRCLFEAPTAKRCQFREGKINEDIDYKYKVLRDCKTWVVSNQKKYYYWQGGESISTGGLRKKDFELREAAELLCAMTSQETYGRIKFLGEVKKARSAFSFLCKIAYYGVSDPSIDKKQIVRELTAEHRKNVGILLKAPMALSRKILAVLFAINFTITEKAIHLARKL